MSQKVKGTYFYLTEGTNKLRLQLAPFFLTGKSRLPFCLLMENQITILCRKPKNEEDQKNDIKMVKLLRKC